MILLIGFSARSAAAPMAVVMGGVRVVEVTLTADQRTSLASQIELQTRASGAFEVLADPAATACPDLSCRLLSGRKRGASALLHVEVQRKVLARCVVTSRLINAMTGKADSLAHQAGRCGPLELESNAQQTICELASGLMAATQPASRPAPATEASAHAAFARAECRLRGFLRQRLTGPVNTLPAQEVRLAARAATVQRELDGIAAYGRPTWTISALCLAGRLDATGVTLVTEGYRSAPLPDQVTRLGRPATRIYEKQLRQKLAEQTRPWVQRAVRRYEACLQRARLGGVLNSHVAAAYQWLHAHDPLRYP